MLNLVRSLPEQLEVAWRAVDSILEHLPRNCPLSISLCGMGGSGISGDLLRGVLLFDSPVPIEVVKDYRLPGWVNREAFAVVTSYSGNTEETLALWRELEERYVPRMVVTSNGELKKLAVDAGIPLLEVPGGLPPRASVGYLFAPLLRLASYWGLCPSAEDELAAATSLIRSRIPEWEQAMQSLAQSIKDSFSVIHTLDVRFASVGYRLVCEINENSKMLAHSHVYPEMNHNELNGFEAIQDGLGDKVALLVLDPGEEFTHPRNRKRIDIISKGLLASIPQYTIKAEGRSVLERLFSMLVQGDLLSVFLAELKGVDPVPVNFIERLKKEMT